MRVRQKWYGVENSRDALLTWAISARLLQTAPTAATATAAIATAAAMSTAASSGGGGTGDTFDLDGRMMSRTAALALSPEQ